MTDFLLCFLLGGAGYVLIELLWRGRSHFSMFIAGGFAFALLHALFQRYALPLPVKCIAGALVITAIEFIAGYIVNLHGAKRMGLFRQAVQSLQTDMPRFRAALGSAFAAHSAAVRSYYKIGAFPGAIYLYL